MSDVAPSRIVVLPKPRRLPPMAAGDHVREGISAAQGAVSAASVVLVELAQLVGDAVGSGDPPPLTLIERLLEAVANDLSGAANRLDILHLDSSPWANPAAWERVVEAAVKGEPIAPRKRTSARKDSTPEYA